VKSERPGANCAHPLKSEWAVDKEHLGDTSDMPIATELVDGPADYFIGRHLAYPQVTNYVSISLTSNSRVVICGAELTTLEEPNESIVKHYRLPTGPHGDMPFVVGLSEGHFRVVVFGRYAGKADARSSGRLSRGATASSRLKTPFQCQKAFPAGAARSRCIARVRSERPGANCAHPLRSEYARDWEHLGDSKDMPITIEATDPPADYFIGRHVAPPEVTNYESVSFTSDTKVTVCYAELITYEDPNGTTVKHYRLPTGPHGNTPFVVGATEGSYRVLVFGQLRASPSRG
jgi:hypothetical protein